MIKRLLTYAVLCYSLFQGCAQAVVYPYPAVTQYRAEYNYTPTFKGPYQSGYQAACDDFNRLWMSTVAPGQTWIVTSCAAPANGNGPRVYIQQKNNTNNTYNTSIWSYLRCPDGGIRNGSMCIEDPDEKPKCVVGTKTTVVYKLVDANGKQVYSPAVDGSSDGQCRIKLVDVKQCYLGTDGASYCQYVGERTGDLLATSATYPPPVTPEVPAAPGDDSRIPANAGKVKNGTACPKGTVAGGFSADGMINCIGTGSIPRNQPPAPPVAKTEKTEANAEGGNTTTTTTTKTNSDGSKTVIVERVIVTGNGEVRRDETRDTGPKPDGNPGKETPDKPEQQKDFCKQNPNLSVCRESSVSGSCGETACTGDAIQCATLRSAAAMECKQREDETLLKESRLFSDGQAAANGTDPMQGALPVPGKGETVNMQALKADGWLGAGAPMRDVSFTIQGRTITVPLSKATEYLLPLRYALMVVASLLAFRMLSSTILKE